MENTEKLRQLEHSLKHLMCMGIQEPERRKRMDEAVVRFVREEASQYTEQEFSDRFDSIENTFRTFLQYLIGKGLIEVTNEPDH